MTVPHRRALPILASGLAIALAGLSACSQKAKDDTTEAADSVAADANATMARAVNSVDAASDKAFGKGRDAVNEAGPSLKGAGDRAGNALDSAGDTVGDAADGAKHATGRALKKAGTKLDQ